MESAMPKRRAPTMLSTYITMEKALTAGVPARWSSTLLRMTMSTEPAMLEKNSELPFASRAAS